MRASRLLFMIILAGLTLAATAQELPEQIEMRLYSVADLTAPARNFPGPEIELGPKPQKSPDKEDAAASRNSESSSYDASITELIKTRLRPDLWDPATGVAIEEKGGLLIVMQRPSVHRLIGELLDALRKAGKVNVAIKGLLVPAAAIPRNTIFTHDELLKALEPGGVAGALASPRVVCESGQRMHSAMLRSSSYRDVAVIGNALNPTLATTLNGTSFDVAPRLSADRASLELELRFTHASTLDNGAPPERVRSCWQVPSRLWGLTASAQTAPQTP